MHRNLRVGLCLGLLATASGLVGAQGAAAPVGDGLLGTYYQGRSFDPLRHRQVKATIDFRRRQFLVKGVPAEDFSNDA